MTPKDVRRVFALLKNDCTENYSSGHLPEAWRLFNNAGALIQEFNWEYSDADLERVLQGIAAVWLPIIPKDFRSVNDRVVVVDDWCTSYVLVLQYIEALVEAGKDVFYITSREPSKVSRGSILNRVEELSNVRALSFPHENTTPDDYIYSPYNNVSHV